MNQQLMLQGFIGVTLTLTGALVGYRTAVSSLSDSGGSRASRWIGLSGVGQTNCNFPSRMGKSESDLSAENESNSEARSFIPNNSEYLAVVEKNHLQERDRKIASLLPRTEVGRLLGHAVTLLNVGSVGNTQESRLLSEDLKLLARTPEDTYQMIRDSIRSMGNDLSEEQQYLIHLVGGLEINYSDKLDFLFTELSRISTGQEAQQNSSNKMAALTALLQMGVDPSTLEKKLKEALSAESSYLAKSRLVSLYEVKYPESAMKLKDDLGI